MTLWAVRRWFNNLPPRERDLPIVILNGVAYSPRAILLEVERGTPLGERLQEMVETGRLGTTAQEELALAKLRLMEILKKYPPDKPLVASLSLNPKVYTASELLRELERGGPVATQLLHAELSHMRTVISLGRIR